MASASTSSTNWLKEAVLGWVPLILLVIFVKSCVIDQYTIPSGSMEPTLHGDTFFKGDRVLVNKWLYGPRIPFTNIRPWKWQEPERWDIVVFTPTEGSSDHSTLIKRVVGLPGERIQIKKGKLHVNGEEVPIPEEVHSPGGIPMDYPSHMPRGIEYYNPEDIKEIIRRSPSIEQQSYFAEVLERYNFQYGIRSEDEFSVVPEGQYLVLGDNSLFSVDGRVHGWVPHNHLLGKAVSIWYPFSRRRDITGWTHTLWGKGLLIGIPLLIVWWEVRHARSDRRRKAGPENPTSDSKEDIPPTD